MLRIVILIATHAAALGLGFLIGIYALPILTAPKGPDAAMLEATATGALYKGRFERNLKGSDFVHWGEGEVRVLPDKIAHAGRLAPGPDYKLYLTPEFVDTKEGFLAIKDKARRIGDVKTFDGFIVDVPAGVDVSAYTTAIVWCEAFSQFITAAKYR
ncbi:MAG: DM13 domain-containing protein [Hyphomicrobium sp.]|uniref:DM13 domain-containing protein n=1 Tax=Hyphomicrobium sp. TaxID=82 RepID=UPI0013235409|nr:DM13 domain-containing protein [Hyphomicrobium sp.]KAB2942281.1 MAG: DM13 domain-containing protein [Hyphomicrobium sp.]MBZ0208424.1 DM13 domain-containing protein [Hyphomicrobium sp.]MCZ7595577.1 DM13 domain-containing protein [Hyphomicrobium sp.]